MSQSVVLAGLTFGGLCGKVAKQTLVATDNRAIVALGNRDSELMFLIKVQPHPPGLVGSEQVRTIF